MPSRKSESKYIIFHSADPFVKWYSYCLSLYNILWMCFMVTVNTFFETLNKILRKVWNLPCNSHTAIVHCIAQTHTVCNLLHKRFCSFLSLALSSTSLLIKSVFTDSSNFVHSFTGYNFTYGHQHIRFYDDRDHSVAISIRWITVYTLHVRHLLDISPVNLPFFFSPSFLFLYIGVS